MRLLHLSDIHFRSPDCDDPETDSTRPNRSVLVRDLREQVRQDGKIDALLIGGDIAFRGDPAEYTAARAWIEEVVDACGCPPEKIYVVPGNHDVDQRVITGRDPSTRNAQQAIVRAQSWRRDRELRDQLRSDHTARALLAPIEAYNEFAARYQCQVYPSKLFWKQDIGQINGVTFRLFGLSSTILSGSGMPDQRKDELASLFLGTQQTVFEPVPDVVNLAMCHHPFSWFMDEEQARDAFENRTTVQFFGHNHVSRAGKDDRWVRFEAGAVNPDPYLTGWEPGYNIINLDVSGEGADRRLHVQAAVYAWQRNPDCYRPKTFPGGKAYYSHTIEIPASDARGTPAPVSVPPVDAALPPRTSEAEPIMGETHTRRLIYRFWNLNMRQRREVVQRLSLLEEGELELPEPERYGLALIRASERQLLDRLAEEITRVEGGR